MLIETFRWGIQAASQPPLKSTDTVRVVQFGDGYKQVSGSGLNDETLTFEYAFTGRPELGMEIYSFLRRHKTRSFIFTPPLGEMGLWRVQQNTLQKIIRSKTVMNISATFEQAFHP